MLTNLLQKLFGGYLEKKAALYDGTPTEGKAWFKSKVILGSIYLAIRGLYETASGIAVASGHGAFPQFPAIVDGLAFTILGVTMAKGRTEASVPIVVSEKLDPKDQAAN